MKITVPTYLTIFRMAAAVVIPLIFVLVPGPEGYWAVAGLFLVASVTDWIDGQLARKFDLASRLGSVLDPIADKMLVASALLVVIAGTENRLWLIVPASVIFARELLVSGLREFGGGQDISLNVSLLAKCKTVVQMAALLILMLCGALETEPGSLLIVTGVSAVWIAAVLTLVTGADYFFKALPGLREESQDA